jgi:hypothetical protein
MVRPDITEEGMDGGESDITRRHGVVALLLQMGKKREDHVRLNVIQVQIAHIDLSIRSDEAKQKHQTVAVAVDGVRAHSTKPGHMIGEVIPQAGRQAVRLRRLHGLTPFFAAGTTKLPVAAVCAAGTYGRV